ncbi:uncharacterized protein BXZ73DRAFT_106345 [Epithele typhae]|uniref:uncharacterized protein n=1 Tax=Epithele typhae TaxID=378194 RepID=UPI0020083904|nr:uncharacterized protein BXZ73DRAFT_106345 [Epithele typhae]KAH9915035.1 hypothetical protein BXZ73DRAFT_106345 [Epithele typhae]
MKFYIFVALALINGHGHCGYAANLGLDPTGVANLEPDLTGAASLGPDPTGVANLGLVLTGVGKPPIFVSEGEFHDWNDNEHFPLRIRILALLSWSHWITVDGRILTPRGPSSLSSPANIAKTPSWVRSTRDVYHDGSACGTNEAIKPKHDVPPKYLILHEFNAEGFAETDQYISAFVTTAPVGEDCLNVNIIIVPANTTAGAKPPVATAHGAELPNVCGGEALGAHITRFPATVDFNGDDAPRITLVNTLPPLRMLQVGNMALTPGAVEALDLDLNEIGRAENGGGRAALQELHGLHSVQTRETRWWMIGHDGDRREMVEVWRETVSAAFDARIRAC